MPNTLAYVMLAIWPLVIWQLFLRLPPGRALIWSVLSAYLILPSYPARFDFPLMPALDKVTLPDLAILVCVFFMVPRKLRLLPQSPLAKALVLTFIFSPILTVLTNPEPLHFHFGEVRGLILQDAIALPITQFLSLIGFLLARNLLTETDDQRDLLLALLIGGMLYSLPMLLEVRLSPQLNNWVYGYYQHLFSQSVRGDGYRPIVFLYHGIWVAFFTLSALVAALGLWKSASYPRNLKYLLMSGYLAVILVLCRTLASMVYGLFVGLAVIFLKRRAQIWLAMVLAVIALTYPLLKGVDLVPSQTILAQAEKISTERAASLKFRLDNEDILLERANEKPLFGWGIWGRNHEHDPATGQIRTVTDGRWVLTLGVFGWVGFLAEFGLIALPIFLIAAEVRRRALVEARNRRLRRVVELAEFSPYLGPLCLLLAVNLFDMIPNATITPLTWLISGALLGHAEKLGQMRDDTSKEKADRLGLRTILK
ncbi:hypothetical protein [Shimia biformata]|uniref:hypothetical protein n=1 Tax=Shimia biformata TaxID=1294299 RepID=UPI00194E0695|nr:hypothetical protein [Shimia biformata]